MQRFFKSIARIAKWIAIGLVGLIGVLILGANVYGWIGRYQLDRHLDVPGRLVDVGTHEMHMYCVGDGVPTVVLDAGGGSFFVDFAVVLEEAQRITRVCAFDRAGMGWSEPGPDSPSPESRLRDLEALLSASGEAAPFVFGGHSLGGTYAWLYAQRHLEQAAGLIAIDAAPRDGAELERLRPQPANGARDRILRAVETLGFVPLLIRLLETLHPEPDRYGAFPSWAIEVVERRPFLSQFAVTELRMASANSEAATTMSDLGALPLIVIAHDDPGFFFDAYRANRDAAARAWREMQSDMATLSSNAEFIVAESSDHQIPLHRPDVIVEAIRRLTETYRASPNP